MSDDPYDTARTAQTQAARRLRRRRRNAHKQQAATAPLNLASGSAQQLQGHAAEIRARQYLAAQGLHILATNLHCRAGEIDLVARDGDTLVFIEVRQRTGTAYGGAAASVNRRKQARLVRAARYFLPKIAGPGREPPPCRFDVIALDGPQLTWIRGAFEQGAIVS